MPVSASAVSTMGPAAPPASAGSSCSGRARPRPSPPSWPRSRPERLGLPDARDDRRGGRRRLAPGQPGAGDPVGPDHGPHAERLGQITATATRVGRRAVRLGVSVDLAPVLDVDGRAVEPGAADPDGYRSFSGSRRAPRPTPTAFRAGLAQAGVTAVVKHFPGLGGATGNTDDGPAATRPWSVLKTTGLVPFRARDRRRGAGGHALERADPRAHARCRRPLERPRCTPAQGPWGSPGSSSPTRSAPGRSARGTSRCRRRRSTRCAPAPTRSSSASPRAPATPLPWPLRCARRSSRRSCTGTLARATLVAAAAQVLAARDDPCAAPTTTAP